VKMLVAMADRFPSQRMYLDLVLTLLLVRCRYPDRWRLLLDAVHSVSLHTALQRALWELAVAHGEPDGHWQHDSALEERDFEIGEVIHILNGVPTAWLDEPDDALAPVLFDLLVDRFLTIEGRLATDYNTPASVVRLMVSLLAPISAGSRIHDPHCRTGNLLAVAVAQLAGAASEAAGVIVTGRDPDLQKCRLARMRLALIGVSARLVSDYEYGLLGPPSEPGLYDVVLTDPPFNYRGPVHPSFECFRWPFGEPPANANFAWLQYAVYLLREGGRAVMVMANNASFSSQPREQHIRRAMIENGAVECVIALPSHLFTGSAIAPTLWILKKPTGRGDDILFIDAHSLGHMQSRIRRVLLDSDIDKIVNTHRVGRTEPHADARPPEVESISRAVTFGEIRDRDYSLNPATYVKSQPATGPGAPSVEGPPDLVAELDDLESQAAEIDAKVRGLIRGLGLWTR